MIFTPAIVRKQWVEKWIGQPIEQWDEQEKHKVLSSWTERWTKEQRKLERIVPPGTDPGTDPGKSQVVPEDPPSSRRVLKLLLGLRKAESAVLAQARTGWIGLARFLYSRKVPRSNISTVPVLSWRRNVLTHGPILH